MKAHGITLKLVHPNKCKNIIGNPQPRPDPPRSRGGRNLASPRERGD